MPKPKISVTFIRPPFTASFKIRQGKKETPNTIFYCPVSLKRNIFKKSFFHWTKHGAEGILNNMERDVNVEKAPLSEMRKPKSNLIDRVTLHNQILLHNYKESVEKSVGCQLLGCCQSFSLTLIPNQILYPKYCEEHRSEFRRQNYLRQFANQPKLYHFGTVRVIEPNPDFPRVESSEAE